MGSLDAYEMIGILYPSHYIYLPLIAYHLNVSIHILTLDSDRLIQIHCKLLSFHPHSLH